MQRRVGSANLCLLAVQAAARPAPCCTPVPWGKAVHVCVRVCMVTVWLRGEPFRVQSPCCTRHGDLDDALLTLWLTHVLDDSQRVPASCIFCAPLSGNRLGGEFGARLILC